jgi:phosphogluconate dehydratase
VHDGDLVSLDADTGILELHVSAYDLENRTAAQNDDSLVFGTGRELFAAFRSSVGPADEGASVFPTHGFVEDLDA